jgi:predicted oxidoreductase
MLQNQNSNSLEEYQLAPFMIGTMRMGQWGSRMKESEIEEFIEGCIALDLMDFDHADIYGSYTTEADFGAVLRKRPDLRDQMRITTKCGIKLVSENRPEHRIKSYDLTKDHIKQSVENSLLALHTDYIDTLLLHRPDYLLNPHEIAASFTALKKEGKVKYFGVSNFSVSQFDLLQEVFPLCTHQVEISLLHREAFENGILDQCQKWGIRPTAWSPLGGGILLSPSEDSNISKVQTIIAELGEKHNAQPDQVLLAWLRKHPAAIVPVLGSSQLSRIKNATDSLKIKLTHEEWYMLWQAATGTEIA